MTNRSYSTEQQEWLEKAVVLAEALPYMRQFSDETFVIKYGGSAMIDPALARIFARNIVLLKQVGINPIVVHGGGPQISRMLERLQLESSFIDGLRVTDQSTLEVVEMVLCGQINKQIVQHIHEVGGMAVGLSGKDGNLMEVKKLRRTRRDPHSNIETIIDLGFVGEPTSIHPDILVMFEESEIIPVIAPIGVGPGGETYNVNADSAAGAIASSLAASKLIILTDVAGVLDHEKQLISELTVAQSRKLIRDQVIKGGMLPKLETCLRALEYHTEAAHVLDGRIPHVLLLEIFTQYGIGTKITVM